MKIAYCTVGFYELDLLECIPLVKRLGYQGIEINVTDTPWFPAHLRPDASTGDLRLVKESLAENDLEVSSLSCKVSFVEPASSARRDSIAYTKECVDLAVELGTDIVHGLSGKLASGDSPEDAWGRLCEGIVESVDWSEGRGVRYALEPVENHIVFGTDDMLRLLAAIDERGRHLYVNYDPSHLILLGDDPADSVRRLADRIIHVHMKDAEGTASGFTFPPLGRGKIDFSAIARALQEIGYSGYLSIEYEGPFFGGFTDSAETIAQESRLFVEDLIR